MLTVLIVVVLLLLLFGGGYGYRSGWYGASPYAGPGIGIIGLILIVLVVMFLIGYL